MEESSPANQERTKNQGGENKERLALPWPSVGSEQQFLDEGQTLTSSPGLRDTAQWQSMDYLSCLRPWFPSPEITPRPKPPQSRTELQYLKLSHLTFQKGDPESISWATPLLESSGKSASHFALCLQDRIRRGAWCFLPLVPMWGKGPPPLPAPSGKPHRTPS